VRDGSAPHPGPSMAQRTPAAQPEPQQRAAEESLTSRGGACWTGLTAGNPRPALAHLGYSPPAVSGQAPPSAAALHLLRDWPEAFGWTSSFAALGWDGLLRYAIAQAITHTIPRRLPLLPAAFICFRGDVLSHRRP